MSVSFLVALVFLFSSFEPLKIDERIRRKVENLSVTKTLSGRYEVYCIPSLREVYLGHDFNPFWITDEKVNDFLDIIGHCEEEGLHPEDYHYSKIREIQNSNTDDARATLDILLSDAFLLYSSHLLSGKTNPETIDPEWHVLKTDANPLKYLYEVPYRSLRDILPGLEPNNKNYHGFKEQLRFYRSLQTGVDWEKIHSGDFIKPGMSDERIPSIRRRLMFLEELPENADQVSILYDDSLKTAISRFQERHGLEALGNIGKQTIEMLNLSPEERIKILTVNMERLRWLPRELPSYYLLVNIAGFDMDVILDDTLVRKYKVIVGKDYRKTPVFSSTMQYMVFNPTWTVPPTILKEDVIPAVRKDPSYLSSKNIQVYNSTGTKMNPDSLNWRSNKIQYYTFIQDPGPNNALGLVKFMFPNKFSIYLHDTPSRELFNKAERALSSGCIRVQDPLELAEFLLRDQPAYARENIKKIIQSKTPTTVRLKSKPDVYLIYLTAWVDEGNRVNYRKDIYQRDQAVYNALQEKPHSVIP